MNPCILFGPTHICLAFNTVYSHRTRYHVSACFIIGAMGVESMHDECVMPRIRMSGLEPVPRTQFLMYGCSSASAAVALKLLSHCVNITPLAL